MLMQVTDGIGHIPVCSPLSGKRSRVNVVGVVVPAIPDAAQLHDDSDSHSILETDDGIMSPSERCRLRRRDTATTMK